MEFKLENLKEDVSVRIIFKTISDMRCQKMWVEFTCLGMESRNVPSRTGTGALSTKKGGGEVFTFFKTY